MSDFDRPPLDQYISEAINTELHEVDRSYWPSIEKFLVPKFIPLATPVPPQRPLQYLNYLKFYAEALFKTEAKHYEEFRDDRNYPPWLSRLQDRVVVRVLDAISRIEGGNPKALLGFHGVGQDQIISELHKHVGWIRSSYVWAEPATGNVPVEELNSEVPASAILPQNENGDVPTPLVSKRLSSQIYSPSAAAKMAAYMNKKGLNQTEFSIQAGTSDKTIRKFIKTGYIKRSILLGIASAMGTSKDDLLL